MIASKLKDGQYPPPVFNVDLTPMELSLLKLIYYARLRAQDAKANEQNTVTHNSATVNVPSPQVAKSRTSSKPHTVAAN